MALNFTQNPLMQSPVPNMTSATGGMFTPMPQQQKPKTNLFDFQARKPFEGGIPAMQQSVPKITATPQQLQRGGQIIEKEKEIKELTGMGATEYERVKSEKKLSYDQAQKFAKANGISVQEAVKGFAEKGYSVGRQGLGSYMKESFQEFAAPAVGLAVGVSDTGQKTVGKGVEKVTKGIVKALGGDPSRVNTQTNTEFMGNILGDMAESGRAKFGREIGRIAGSTALTAPVGGLAKGVGTLGKIGVGALEGVTQGAAYNVSAGRNALEGVGTAGILGAAVPGVGATASAAKPYLKGAGNVVAKRLLNSKIKLTNTHKDAIRKAVGEEWTDFALKNDIVGKNTDEMIQKAENFANNSMAEKFKVLGKIKGTTPMGSRENIIASSIVKQAKKDIEEIYDMPFDKINKKDIAPELLEDFTIISNVEKLMKKGNATASEKEALKSLYDIYNSHLKYDPVKSRVLSGAEKVRLGLQKDIESLGKSVGADINKLNKNISGAKALQKGLTQASDRMDNTNIFGLSDSQTAILSTMLGGGPAETVAILGGKSILDNVGVRSSIAKSLYNKGDDVSSISTAPMGERVTARSNISRQFGNRNTPVTNNIPSTAGGVKSKTVMPFEEYRKKVKGITRKAYEEIKKKTPFLLWYGYTSDRE